MMTRSRSSRILLFSSLYWLSAVASDVSVGVHPGGILYPRESETREVKSLDGIWNFRLSANDSLQGFKEKWYIHDLAQSGPVIPMPVPSSYNDITLEKKIRDYTGLVWYDRTFFVPDSWRQQAYHVWLRFGSVHYAAQVWINGHLAMCHEIGHLPFHREITEHVQFGKQNRITVAVDNTLTQTTIPQGTVSELGVEDRLETVQSYTFDFFNYAGIHRSVHLYSTPAVYIDDITVLSDVNGVTGLVYYNVTVGGPVPDNTPLTCTVDIIDKAGKLVVREKRNANVNDFSGVVEVPDAKLWWPYLMHPNPGYMYTLQVQISSKEWGNDVYRLPIGIRTLKWNNTSFTINDKPVYMRGFGRHEDSDIRGKGLDWPLIARDYNLMKWIGANAYRTSHYPYAEEIMDMADQQGIMIVDECPAVDLENYSPILLKKHVNSLTELIRRDKNRPSVIMWSIANEPRSQQKEADAHFRLATGIVRAYDNTRPLTAALNQQFSVDLAISHNTSQRSRSNSSTNRRYRSMAYDRSGGDFLPMFAQFIQWSFSQLGFQLNFCLFRRPRLEILSKEGQYLDIIGFNRYNSWYSNTGRLEVIRERVEREAYSWHAKYNKPVFMAEYGADTMAGLHIEPSYVWSEEYQVQCLSEHFRAFDNLRKNASFFIGEMIWNFADFKTAQTTTRVGGNKKGVFTRERQPKEAAHHVRKRYWLLGMELDNLSLPSDLIKYYANVLPTSSKTEL